MSRASKLKQLLESCHDPSVNWRLMAGDKNLQRMATNARGNWRAINEG